MPDEVPSDVPPVVQELLDPLIPDGVAESGFVPPPLGVTPQDRRWWGRHLSELRWQAELARLLVDPVYRGVDVPRGDGEPVILIPGFLANDQSLSVMAGWLRRIGYAPHRSGIWLANADCSDRAVARLEARITAVVARSGRPVALLGHSRGGHFAKALAARRPDLVDRVIVMGTGLDTPFDISIPTKAAVSGVRTLLQTSDLRRRSGCLTTACRCAFAADYSAPFPPQIPLTSIYTKEDGVVWWEACVVPYARTVEVTGSHIGLAFNRKAYRAIAAALAAPGD